MGLQWPVLRGEDGNTVADRFFRIDGDRAKVKIIKQSEKTKWARKLTLLSLWLEKLLDALLTHPLSLLCNHLSLYFGDGHSITVRWQKFPLQLHNFYVWRLHCSRHVILKFKRSIQLAYIAFKELLFASHHTGTDFVPLECLRPFDFPITAVRSFSVPSMLLSTIT